MKETGLSLMKTAFNKDGWVNVLTGLGLKNRDKRMSATAMWCPMQEQETEELYAADAMAAKIVDLLPFDGMRAGWECTGVEDAAAKAKLYAPYRALEADAAIVKAWTYGRLYGGAAIFLITPDADQSAPMKPGSQIVGLTVFNRWELQTDQTMLQNDVRLPHFGEPEVFLFSPRSTQGSATRSVDRIHRSRLILFPGVMLPRRLYIQNQYWHDSVLNRLKNAIRNWATAHDSSASIIQDFRIPVFKIKNLADKISGGDDQEIIKRLEIVNLARSIARAVVIDAEGEDFDYKTSSVAGLGELVDKADDRLVAESGIPHTILLGESPSGLGATGRSEEGTWYDFVASQQETYLKPRHKQLFYAIVYGSGAKLPADYDIEYKPLEQMNEKDQAEVRYKQAQIDDIYIGNATLDPNEVRESRFGGEKYSHETHVEGDAPTPEPEPQPIVQQVRASE